MKKNIESNMPSDHRERTTHPERSIPKGKDQNNGKKKGIQQTEGGSIRRVLNGGGEKLSRKTDRSVWEVEKATCLGYGDSNKIASPPPKRNQAQ